jgi:hypothetical protein
MLPGAKRLDWNQLGMMLCVAVGTEYQQVGWIIPPTIGNTLNVMNFQG